MKTRGNYKNKIILHLDLDAFFAQAETLRHPELKNKPLVIGADPKGGKGRGVVSTASYEARKFGIHSGQPISKAFKLCKNCFFLKPDINYYKKISKRIFKILKKYSKRIEKAGLDEAYLDISYTKDFKKAEELGRKIKKEVFAKEKLTCSIGISVSKKIAKIASGYHKPNGLTIVKKENLLEFLKNLDIERIPGIGPKTASILKKYGIRKVNHLKLIGKDFLEKILGKKGRDFYYLSLGIDNEEIKMRKKRNSIGREYTFEKDILDKNFIFSKAKELLKNLLNEISKKKIKISSIVVKIRYSNFETHTYSQKINSEELKFDFLFKKVKKMIEKFLDNKKIRLIGLRFLK